MACDIITESLIKGIIVTYSRTGITIQQIANVYYECTGENWPLLSRGEEQAIRYLEQIEGILSIRNEKNETLWYVRGKTLNGEKRGQIYRSNNPLEFDLTTNPHGNDPNTCPKYNNNNRIRNTRSNNYNKNNGHNGDINGNCDPRNTKHQKHFANNQRVRVNGHSFGSSNNNDSTGSGGSGGSGSTADNDQKTSASLYGFDLVGDDFFMEMAKIDLGSHFTNRKQIHRSGFCISGQRISAATDRLKRFPHTDNMRIIVNLGTVDILHGRDLNDMCHDYMNLVKVCYHRNINIVITTLAPIANRLHNITDVQKWRDFNEFLVNKFGDKYQVIDIAKCMICPKTGKTLFDCFQPFPKYMSGTTQPHMLWNRIGRQRILKEIKARLRL